MGETAKKVLLWAAAAILLFLATLMIGNLHQILMLTSAVHPVFGRVVTAVTAVFYTALFLVPAYGLSRLPKPLLPPADPQNEEARAAYHAALKKRLGKNKSLAACCFSFDESKPLPAQLQDAYAVLDEQALAIISKTSSSVFLTTAVSQNGVLDGIFVLAALARMVWAVSRLYNQRPHLRESFYLYANVAATVIMARELEDLALLDQELLPIIDSLLGSTLSTLVPGASAVVNLIVGSVLQGSANAFLALRVGAMTKRYAKGASGIERRQVKRSSSVEAAALIGAIIQKNAAHIVKAYAAASKKATIDRTVEKLKASASRTEAIVKGLFQSGVKRDL